MILGFVLSAFFTYKYGLAMVLRKAHQSAPFLHFIGLFLFTVLLGQFSTLVVCIGVIEKSFHHLHKSMPVKIEILIMKCVCRKL